MPSQLSHRSPETIAARGFTVIELMLVVVLVAILITLVAPVSDKVRARAEAARCAANLRALHAALGAYVSQNGHWPQPPKGLDARQTTAWWITELQPMGMTRQAWLCPAIERSLDESGQPADQRPEAHYGVTGFDAKQFTPYRWPKQPWAIEMGSMHGRGNLMLFPDGSIRSLNDVIPEAAAAKLK